MLIYMFTLIYSALAQANFLYKGIFLYKARLPIYSDILFFRTMHFIVLTLLALVLS